MTVLEKSHKSNVKRHEVYESHQYYILCVYYNVRKHHDIYIL